MNFSNLLLGLLIIQAQGTSYPDLEVCGKFAGKQKDLVNEEVCASSILLASKILFTS